MKKVLAVIGALLVVIIAALLVIPSLIDWNGYKAEITTAVQEATGRNLEIKGDLSLSLLPSPALSVEDASLGNAPGATDPNMVSVKEVRVSVALMPLLTGNIHVTDIHLINPVVSIETFADGRNNLTFNRDDAPGSGPDAGTIASPEDKKEQAPTPPADGGNAPAKQNNGGSDLASSVRVDSLSVENATIIYRSPGSVQRVEGLTLSVSADSLNGPAKGEGYVFYQGIPLTFNLEVGKVSQTAPFPVSVHLGIDKVDGGIDVGGTVDLSAAAPRFNGDLSGKFDDLRNAALRIAGDKADIPEAASQPFELSGKIGASAKQVTVNDLSVRIGDTRGTGALSIDQDPKIKADLALRFNQLDLDSILALASATNVPVKQIEQKAEADQNGKSTASQGQSIPNKTSESGAKSPSAGPVIPADLGASIDLEVDTLVYNKTPIHGARINAAIANSKIVLNEVSAGLPGGTDLEVAGSISGAKPKLSADLRYEVASENIRAVLRWLGVDLQGIRADRLRRFSLTGGIKGTSDQLNINNVDMRLDDTAIRGAVVANLDGKGLPALGIGLKLDKINLDQYLPEPTEGQGSDKTAANAGQPAETKASNATASASNGDASGADAQALIKTIHDALAPIKGLAANYRLGADEVTLHDVKIRGISLEGSLRGGNITLKNAAIADAAGLSASASGSFLGANEVPALDGVKLGVTAKNLEPLVKLTGITLPAPASNYNGIKADVALGGPITGPDVDLAVHNALMQLSVKGKLSDTLGATPGLKGKVSAQASSLNRVLPLVAPSYDPKGNLGRLVLNGDVDGNAKKIALNIAQLAVGQFSTKGTVDYSTTDGGRSKINVDLNGGKLAVDPFLPSSKQASLDRPRSGMGRAAIVLPGQDDLLTRVNASDGTPWDDTVIDVSALLTIDGVIKIALDQLDFDTYSLVKPNLNVNLDQGLVTINKLAGLLGEGDLDISGTFDARKDIPKLDIKGSLDEAKIQKVTPIRVSSDMINGVTSVTFDATASGNTSRKLVSALNGTANLKMHDVRFSNADKRSVDPKLDLRALLQQGPESMVVEGVGNNDLLRTLDADFKITNGIVKTTKVDATSRVGTADADATLDLPKWVMDTKANFDFSDKINNLPPFSVYAKGKIDDPAISGRMDKVAVKTLENLLGKALGNKNGGSSSSSDDGKSSKKRALEDTVKGLLNQFGR